MKARAATAALLLAAALAAGCTSTAGDGPRPAAVTPDRGSLAVPVTIRVRGAGFGARVTADFTDPAGSGIDAAYQALLGTVALQDVALEAGGELTATVPAGLASGTYDLTVIDPWGRAGTLRQAYRVLFPSDVAAFVTGFRIDPVGAQEAFRPFVASIAAVDASGAVVADFNGTVRLSELTGTGVPANAARFVAGRWTGLVEVRAAHLADVWTVQDERGVSGTSNPFAVASPRAAAVRFTTPPVAAVAGRCAGPITLALEDAFGAPARVDQATAVALAAAPADGVALYGDAACGAPIASPTVAAGESSASVWLVATRAGALDLAASVAGMPPAAQRGAVSAGPPSAIAFVTSPQAVNVDACSMPATVEIRDAFGNPSPPGAASLTLAAAPAGGLTFFAGPACAGETSSLALGGGAARADFWFTGSTGQPVTVTVAGAGLAPASQQEIVSPKGVATRLSFLTPPRATSAGACSEEVTLETQDSLGQAVASAGAVMVSLSVNPDLGLATFSDPACTVPASTIEIGAGQSTGGFHYRGRIAGTVPITASSTTLSGASQDEVVTPAAPARVVFASPAQTVSAGACSDRASLEVRDALGNAASAGAPIPVALSAEMSTGFGFYADAACRQPISALTVEAGTSGASFWFRGTQAGPVVISTAPGGLAGDAQTEQVRAAAATRLAFTSAPQTVVAGACSGAAALQVRDAFGNPATLPGAAMVALAAAPPAGFAFFRDAACAVQVPTIPIPDGGDGATFFFSATLPGAVTVAAVAAGLEPATQVEAVNAALPAQLAFATHPQVVAAGACSGPVTLESRDPFGNPSPVAGADPASIGLTASPAAGVAFHAGEGCAGAAVSAVSIAAGASAVTFSFRATAAGSLTLTAASPLLGSAAQVETVDPLAPDRVAFETAPQTRRVGTCSAPVTIRTEDGHGNPSPVAAATAVALSVSPPAGLALYADPACTSAIASATVPAGRRSATFYFKGTSAGSYAVTAAPAGMASASQAEDVVDTTPDHLAFATPAQTVTAGACSDAVVVRSVDAGGRLSPVTAATAVGLTASPGAGFSFFEGAGCAGAAVTSVAVAAGETDATFSFRATQPGPVTVSASAAGLSPSPTQEETIVAPTDVHLVFTSPAQTVTSGACSAALGVQAVDAAGNATRLAAATPVALTASPGAGVTFFAAGGCAGAAVTSVSIPAGGSAVAFSFRATASGVVTISAAAAGMSPDPTQAEVVQPAPADHLAFTTAAQIVTVGACSAAVGVQTADASGNASPASAATTVALSASPAAGVSFHAGAGCAGPAVSSVTIAAGTSGATFSFRATASGVLTITAAAAGMSPSPTQVETVRAATADHLVFTSGAQTVAAGACSAAVGLQTLDASGNVSPAAAATSVTLTASPAGGVSFYAGAGCGGAAVGAVTLAAGASEVTFSFRSTVSGTVTVTAAAAGLAPSPAQDETVVPGALDHFTWSAIRSPQPAALPFPVTVTARDAFGNVATAFTGTAALAASAGTATCSSSCTSASVTGGFLAGAWSGSVAVSPPGTGIMLQATSGGVASGASNAFDVSGAASRSPPIASFTVSPAVIISGNDVAFDAGGSSDYQTAAAQLSVSWSFEATAAAMAGAPAPPAAPWTAWTTAKTATHAFINNGSAPVALYPRLAVRDVEAAGGGPDVAYASATVVVLPNGNGHCTVDTSRDVDDGASSCYALGSDGRLSLREAIRIANGSSTPIAIDFGRAMTIAATGSMTLSRPVYIVGRPGVALDTGTLVVASSGVEISGLELSRQASPVVVQAGGDLTLRDVRMHDGAGLVVQGRARVERLRMSGCAGTCIEVNGAGAYLALFASELRGSGTNTGLALTSCAGAAWDPATLASPYQAYAGAVVVAGNVFSEFGTAVDSSCGAAVVAHDTFVGNGTGVRGIGDALLDCVFTGQTTAAVQAATCPGFTSSGRHLVWQNASDGCLASELAGAPSATVTFSADPLYVYPASGDYRIQYGSPARDLGSSTSNLELDGPGPGRYLGAGPDRGGRETY